MSYPRYLKERLLHCLKVSPVTLLIGPRQSGKTTLMKEVGQELGMDYITFDTLKQLTAAQEDPEGFIKAFTKPVILDEVQRVAQIALPIKLSVDEKKQPGFFGLTGSANPLVAPKLNDSLAGRMFILPMWPLSYCEIQKKKSSVLNLFFDPGTSFSKGKSLTKQELMLIFSQGGYPQALTLDEVTRDEWYDNLLTTILERDVQDLMQITRPSELAKLLSLLANRSSNLLNLAEVSRTAAIAYSTLNHYMVLLESLFLILRQPAWHQSKTKRLIKMPKLYFGDTGLLINQLKIDSRHLVEEGKSFGFLLENFVFLELKKMASWETHKIDFYHYRTQTGIEVDIVLENRLGQVVGLEVKSTETLQAEDWKGLDVLEKEVGKNFIRGIILYPGSEVVMKSPKLLAIPLSTLWDGA